jgi:hypothetical protein
VYTPGGFLLSQLVFALDNLPLLLEVAHQLSELLDGLLLARGSKAFGNFARRGLDLRRLGGERLEVVVQHLVLTLQCAESVD